MFTEEIENLLVEKFKEERFLDCFLVEIVQNAKHLSIFMDSDSALSFDRCQEVSRYLEAFLDEKKLLGEDYVLEVSSPGLSRPLKFPRQFVKNIGRDIAIKHGDAIQSEGNILTADDQQVTITWMEIRKDGKKKIKEIMQLSIDYKLIHEAKIQIRI